MMDTYYDDIIKYLRVVDKYMVDVTDNYINTDCYDTLLNYDIVYAILAITVFAEKCLAEKGISPEAIYEE